MGIRVFTLDSSGTGGVMAIAGTVARALKAALFAVPIVCVYEAESNDKSVGYNCSTTLVQIVSGAVLTRAELRHELESRPNCRLPEAEDIVKAGASSVAAVNVSSGLYWAAAPDSSLVRYAWYVEMPSGALREFGPHVFPARLLLKCCD